MKSTITLVLFSILFFELSAQSDYIVIKNDTLYGTVKLKESTRVSKLLFFNNQGDKLSYNPEEVSYFVYRGIPYISVSAPLSYNTASDLQTKTSGIKERFYFARQLVEGEMDLLVLQEYGVQDRFLINQSDTTIFLPPSNVQQLDTYKGVARRGTNARYFAILKALMWECEEAIELLYNSGYNKNDLTQLIDLYNSSCSEKVSIVYDKKTKVDNINGVSFKFSVNQSSLDYEKNSLIPIDLYELGQINYSSESSFSFGLGYIFMRSNESITSFEGDISYTSISFKEDLVTETDLSNLKVGINMRLHPVRIGSVAPMLKIGSYGAFFTNPSDTFIEIQNSNVGNTFDDVPVIKKEDINSPAFGFNVGVGLLNITPSDKEFGLEFRYDFLLSQIVNSISNSYNSYRLVLSYKL